MATFRKHEHLKSRRLIEDLMKKGHSVSVQPFKLIWMPAELTAKVPVQVAFAVPKRNFARAVDRNKIKRQMRECYRDHKNKLYDFLNGSKKQCALMLIFTSKEAMPFSELMLKFALTLQRFEKDSKKAFEQHHDRVD